MEIVYQGRMQTRNKIRLTKKRQSIYATYLKAKAYKIWSSVSLFLLVSTLGRTSMEKSHTTLIPSSKRSIPEERRKIHVNLT